MGRTNFRRIMKRRGGFNKEKTNGFMKNKPKEKTKTNSVLRQKTSRRLACIKSLIEKEPGLSAREIAERLNIDVSSVYRGLRSLGGKKRISSEVAKQTTADIIQEYDEKFARYAFGDRFENPQGEQDEEYKRECERLGYPGFFYIGELWSIYRDFWEHKRAGLTFSKGKWRKATAYDGTHGIDHGYGVLADRTTSARPMSQYKTDINWDDFEDWF